MFNKILHKLLILPSKLDLPTGYLILIKEQLVVAPRQGDHTFKVMAFELPAVQGNNPQVRIAIKLKIINFQAYTGPHANLQYNLNLTLWQLLLFIFEELGVVGNTKIEVVDHMRT